MLNTNFMGHVPTGQIDSVRGGLIEGALSCSILYIGVLNAKNLGYSVISVFQSSMCTTLITSHSVTLYAYSRVLRYYYTYLCDCVTNRNRCNNYYF